MTNEQLFTEIQISLSKLESKLTSLEAAVKELKQDQVTIIGDVKITGNIATDEITKPVRWPNESLTDYLKRIGEYNEAYGVDKLN